VEPPQWTVFRCMLHNGLSLDVYYATQWAVIACMHLITANCGSYAYIVEHTSGDNSLWSTHLELGCQSMEGLVVKSPTINEMIVGADLARMSFSKRLNGQQPHINSSIH